MQNASQEEQKEQKIEKRNKILVVIVSMIGAAALVATLCFFVTANLFFNLNDTAAIDEAITNPQDTTEEVLATYEDQNCNVTVTDTSIIIELPANASTGYSWVSDITPVANESVDVDNSLVGAHGAQKFIFNNDGDTEITFTYERPWEENVVKTLIFTYQDGSIQVTTKTS